MCLVQEFWRETTAQAAVLADMTKPDGELYQYEDRRQEIVFIGHGMDRDAIQNLLDSCLLTDEEFALGPEMWKETMDDLDHIRLELRPEDEDLNEEEAAAERERLRKEKEDCANGECEDARCEA